MGNMLEINLEGRRGGGVTGGIWASCSCYLLEKKKEGGKRGRDYGDGLRVGMKPVFGGGCRKLTGYCYGKSKRGVGTRIRPPHKQELESPSSPPTDSLIAVQKPGGGGFGRL